MFKFLCSIFFGKGTQPFDFIKLDVIRTSTYKVKHIIQINGGLIVFWILGNKIFFN